MKYSQDVENDIKVDDYTGYRSTTENINSNCEIRQVEVYK